MPKLDKDNFLVEPQGESKYQKLRKSGLKRLDSWLQDKVVDPLAKSGHEDLGAAIATVPSTAAEFLAPESEADLAMAVTPVGKISKSLKKLSMPEGATKSAFMKEWNAMSGETRAGLGKLEDWLSEQAGKMKFGSPGKESVNVGSRAYQAEKIATERGAKLAEEKAAADAAGMAKRSQVPQQPTYTGDIRAGTPKYDEGMNTEYNKARKRDRLEYDVSKPLRKEK